jgi:5-methylcytosine-specific restriction enzyme A
VVGAAQRDRTGGETGGSSHIRRDRSVRLVQTAAPSLGVELTPINMRNATEIEQSVTAFVRSGNGGLIVTPSASVLAHRNLIITLAARHYLFHPGEPIAHLSLNQGTTAVREEFGGRARQVLMDRAEFMRKRLSDFAALLPVGSIDLGSDGRLPGDYAAGHALGVTYTFENLPGEEALGSNLQSIVRAYRALTYRGGIEGDLEGHSDLSEEFGIPPQTPIIETRKYAYHRKIERNRTAARYAKKFHGTRCQACELEFVERYGDIGKGFIEAHHLRPIGTLEEGVPVKYDVAADFAVLCSNCHRMIHRFANPSDLASFRAVINKPSLNSSNRS